MSHSATLVTGHRRPTRFPHLDTTWRLWSIGTQPSADRQRINNEHMYGTPYTGTPRVCLRSGFFPKQQRLSKGGCHLCWLPSCLLDPPQGWRFQERPTMLEPFQEAAAPRE